MKFQSCHKEPEILDCNEEFLEMLKRITWIAFRGEIIYE
jgi:hypothetical protein